MWTGKEMNSQKKNKRSETSFLRKWRKCEKVPNPSLALSKRLISKEETNLIKHSQTGLVTLASKIARRLLSCELTLNPNVIHHIVSEALTKITDKSTVSIRVHPDDLPALQTHQSTLKQLVPDIQTLHLDSDPNIEPGGCMIETSLGYIDATVATKLASIELAIQTVDGPTKSEPESDLESS